MSDEASVADTLESAEGAPIGVLGGTGKQGRGLALRLALAGHPVRLGSREADRGTAAAEELRERAGRSDLDLTGGDNLLACQAPLVIASIPYSGLADTLAPLADALAGRVVVSCVVALAFDGDGPHTLLPEEGSAAQRIQALLPRAQVTGAFQNLAAGKLLAAPEPLAGDVLITGDHPAARALTAELVAAIPDLRAVDAGALRLSRPIEELTAVLVGLNRARRTTTSVAITGLGA